MAENHITVPLNRFTADQLASVARGDEDSHDLTGTINGQPITVRFRAEEPDDDVHMSVPEKMRLCGATEGEWNSHPSFVTCAQCLDLMGDEHQGLEFTLESG